jgi:uncharacterized Zn finger protein
MSHYGFRPYVPVAKRRQQAARDMEMLRNKGRAVAPIVLEGRQIARSFWGTAWCDNLERYSDFENRLPRGRTYVRNGSVLDLKIARGGVGAVVSGSQTYDVKIDIAVAAPSRWKAICKDCTGSIGSLVELLQGKLSKNVMERVCREGDGLFPVPSEIRMSCSCPDWAGMCKHVAAALYGVGARLDASPDLLFVLRGVDRSELISTVGDLPPLTQADAVSERLLADDDVASLFGIEMPTVVPPKPADTIAAEKPKEERSVRSAKPAPGRAKKVAARSVSNKTQESVDRDPRSKAPRSSAAIIAAPREGSPARRENSAEARRPSTPAKGGVPASTQTRARSALAPEGPRAEPTGESRRLGQAPVGRTRVAKWIGARARKTHG